MITTKAGAIRALKDGIRERFDITFPTPDRVQNDQWFLDFVDACIKDGDMDERARNWSLTRRQGGRG